MPRYIVTLTDVEVQELKTIVQKGGKGYRIKHAQILLKLDQKPENKAWTYDRIKDAYGASRSTIAGIAKRFVMEGMNYPARRSSLPDGWGFRRAIGSKLFTKLYPRGITFFLLRKAAKF